MAQRRGSSVRGLIVAAAAAGAVLLIPAAAMAQEASGSVPPPSVSTGTQTEVVAGESATRAPSTTLPLTLPRTGELAIDHQAMIPMLLGGVGMLGLGLAAAGGIGWPFAGRTRSQG